MPDVILKTEDKNAVEEMNKFLKTLTEEQKRFMFTTLEGVKIGLQLAEQSKNNDMQGTA